MANKVTIDKLLSTPLLHGHDKDYLRLDATNDPVTGDLLLKPTSDSTSVFQVQQADGTDIFTVDTSTPQVLITRQLFVDGEADEVQSIIQANATQTSNIKEIQDSSGNALGGWDERGIFFCDGGIEINSVYIGNNAGNIAHTNAARNVGIGFLALSTITSGDNNVAVGGGAGAGITTGGDNILIGRQAGNAGNASRNICIGDLVGNLVSLGDNVFIGDQNAVVATTAERNTILGSNAGLIMTTGKRNIFIGYKAGSTQLTNTDLLIIDQTARANPATELTDAIIYGVMNPTVANQTLRLNASVGINVTPTANMTGLAIESGLLTLKETTTPTADTDYGKIYNKSDNRLYWQTGAGTELTIHDSNDTVDIPINITMYDAAPAFGALTQFNGGIEMLSEADTLSNGDDITITNGIGKIVIVVIASNDAIGDITLTGDTVDRNTGAVSVADTDVITLSGNSTDNSTTDSNGNTCYEIDDMYITSKWFTGSITISTTEVDLTDVDVYHVSFEQFNDEPDMTINTFDANIFTTNVNAEFDAYLHTLHVESANKGRIDCESELHVGADGETAIADRHFRLRKGNINEPIDGSTDGFWIDVYYANSPSYVEDVTLKVWATKTQSITLV